MKVSVITVCYNNLEGLKRTYASVTSQSFQDYEYVIIDGGSNDGSKDFLEAAGEGCSWVSEPDEGIYNAMNKGVRMSHGEYCIFMNSGDTFYDDEVLAKAAPLLDGRDFYVGNTVTVFPTRRHHVYSPAALTLESLFDGYIMHQSTFTKTDLLKECPYSEEFRICSDWELFVTGILLHGKTYGHLDMFVSNFCLDGVSFTMQELSLKEREDVLRRDFPVVLEFYRRRMEKPSSDPLERKIQRAMKMPPLSRDMKIFRNSFKFLFKDLYVFLFKHREYLKK